MFFTLQVCMMISLIPPFIVLKEEMADCHFRERQGKNLLNNVFMAMHVLYFANGVVNPFLYEFFDRAFRRKLVDMICKKEANHAQNA